MQKISFPLDEINLLQNRSVIVTTRVSREYNKYHVGERLMVPWGEVYVVSSIIKIQDIYRHPFYLELTQDQIRLISKYKRIAVMTLKKQKSLDK